MKLIVCKILSILFGIGAILCIFGLVIEISEVYYFLPAHIKKVCNKKISIKDTCKTGITILIIIILLGFLAIVLW